MKWLLSLACTLSVVLLLVQTSHRRPPRAGTPYDWGVIYYMSYDNDLHGLGQGIINAIRSGLKSPRTVAAVQADFSGDGGMRRYTITSSGMSVEQVPSEDSADEEQLVSYLNWFVDKLPSKRYVVILLNHGGGVDQMCLDDNPATKSKRWMSGRVLGERLRRFKAATPGDWELLFLQQCGRGSLENLYSFRGTADFIMSSPVVVGAPNTYYPMLHTRLGEYPNATGHEIASWISAEDRHYTIYTCLRTAKLAELPARLDAAIGPLLRGKSLQAPLRAPVVYEAGGEAMVDAKKYLEHLADGNEVDRKSVDAFFDWVDEELFTGVWFRRGQDRRDSCGLSIFQPETYDELLRHDDLDLYKESRLKALWEVALRK